MKEVLLSAKGLRKQFQGSPEPVLHDVDADIFQGDFTVVMGSSGAGKSTLLYTLSAMDSLSGGQVLYKGQDISRCGEKQLARLRGTEFSFVFQQTHLVSSLTLFENVAAAGYLAPGRSGEDVRRRAVALLERMGVAQVKDRLPSQVSGGEAQRAAIARAVICQPGLIFADEPTGALNRRSSGEVLNLLTQLNQEGQSILMVTHDLRSAARGNRLLYLEDGRLLDELALPPFSPESGREREEQISRWLSGLNW